MKPVQQQARRDKRPEPGQDLALERLVFFSDAVFAIVITLLVLPLTAEVELPSGSDDISGHVFGLWPEAMTFAISFLVIGQFWTAHHRLFGLIRRMDAGLLWLNLAFLLTVSFMPFPSAVLGATEDYSNTFAVTFYAVSLTVASVALTSIWLYAVRRGLRDPVLSRQQSRQVSARAAVTSVVFAASVLVSPLGLAAAVTMWLAVLPLARHLVARSATTRSA